MFDRRKKTQNQNENGGIAPPLSYPCSEDALREYQTPDTALNAVLSGVLVLNLSLLKFKYCVNIHLLAEPTNYILNIVSDSQVTRKYLRLKNKGKNICVH